MSRDGCRLLLLGNGDIRHVGHHFQRAAEILKIEACFRDTKPAYAGNLIIRKFQWSLRGHRPAQLRRYSKDIVHSCLNDRVNLLLSTGIAPLNAEALQKVGELGVIRANFLTDDPWNPAHRAKWFMAALPLYDFIFTPRKANISDLQRIGCRNVQYLPFAYDASVHFPESPADINEYEKLQSDVMFVGGADQDRLALIAKVIGAGFQVGLYGGYWERYRETKTHARGTVGPSVIRKAVASARVSLCLVRKANRDENSMSTFEMPAMRGCVLMERTADHQKLFGREGDAVVYFDSHQEMIEKLHWLLKSHTERRRLAERAFEVVTHGANTYQDRLRQILAAITLPRV